MVVVVGVSLVHWLSGRSACHDCYFKMFSRAHAQHAHAHTLAPPFPGERAARDRPDCASSLCRMQGILFLLAGVA